MRQRSRAFSHPRFGLTEYFAGRLRASGSAWLQLRAPQRHGKMKKREPKSQGILRKLQADLQILRVIKRRRSGGRAAARKQNRSPSTQQEGRNNGASRSLPAGRGAHVKEAAYCQCVLGHRHHGNIMCVPFRRPELVTARLSVSLRTHSTMLALSCSTLRRVSISIS